MLAFASLQVLGSSPMRKVITSHHFDNVLMHSLRYDIFAINIASTMIGYVYGQCMSSCRWLISYGISDSISAHGLSIRQDLGVKIATQVGTLCGQLAFGFLADRFGRRRMCTFKPHSAETTS